MQQAQEETSASLLPSPRFAFLLLWGSKVGGHVTKPGHFHVSCQIKRWLKDVEAETVPTCDPDTLQVTKNHLLTNSETFSPEL